MENRRYRLWFYWEVPTRPKSFSQDSGHDVIGVRPVTESDTKQKEDDLDLSHL